MGHETDQDREEIVRGFRKAVNMTASTLEKHLAGEASRSVGQRRDGASEATGHREGRRIVEILRTKKSDLSDDDYQHMRKVVGYVHRHLAQGGPKDAAAVKDSPWRLSLINWGHDPTRTA